MCRNQLEGYLKCWFWFSRSGWGLRVCISDKFTSDAGAAGLWTTLSRKAGEVMYSNLHVVWIKELMFHTYWWGWAEVSSTPSPLSHWTLPQYWGAGEEGACWGIAGKERCQCLETLAPELLCVYGACEVSWLALSWYKLLITNTLVKEQLITLLVSRGILTS